MEVRYVTHSIADTRGSVFSGFQRVHERNDNAGSRITDSVAESNGTTSRVIIRGLLWKFVALKITHPFTLILEGSMLQTFSAMRTTTENASFSSN